MKGKRTVKCSFLKKFFEQNFRSLSLMQAKDQFATPI